MFGNKLLTMEILEKIMLVEAILMIKKEMLLFHQKNLIAGY